MGNIENFKYIFSEKLKGLTVAPKNTVEKDGKVVSHFEVTCPVKRNFICSFDLVHEAPKKRGRPKKNS